MRDQSESRTKLKYIGPATQKNKVKNFTISIWRVKGLPCLPSVASGQIIFSSFGLREVLIQ